MDVICEQCKAEYDFDEALLGEKGTTVKCSRCGHVFRVLPPSREAAPGAVLKLRFARDGSVVPLASLRELQQRIASGEVGREDELGRDGFPFRRLADVPELKNFFGTVGTGTATDPRSAPAPNPVRAAQRTVMGLGPAGAPPVARPASVRPPAQRVGATLEAGEAPTLPATQASLVRGEAPSAQLPAPSLKLPASSLPPPNPRLAPAQGTARAPGGNPFAQGTHSAPARSPFSAQTGLPTPVVPAPQAPRLRFDGDEEGPGSESPARVPISSMPTQPAAAQPGTRAPTSGAPTKPGPIPMRGLALDTAEAIEDRPDATPVPGRAHHGTPLPPRSQQAKHPMGLNTEDRLERPGGFPRSFQGAPATESAATQVKLRVGEDESPRDRDEGGSKLPYIAGGAVLLAAAAWGVLAILAGPKEAVTNPASTLVVDAGAAAAPALEAGAFAAATLDAATAPVAHDAQTAVGPAPVPAAPKPAETRTAEKPPATPKANEPSAKAAPAAHEAAAPAGKDYGALVARGDQLFAKKDLAGAREAYTAAVAMRATGSEANSGLGFVLLAQGDLRAALPVLTRAAGSGYAEASVGLGDVQRKLGNTDDAIEAYGTYLARMPNGPRASYARAQLDALSGNSPSSVPNAKAGRDTEEPQNAPSSDYQPAGEVKSPGAGAPSTDTPNEPGQ